jgi:hypothetical protein
MDGWTSQLRDVAGHATRLVNREHFRVIGVGPLVKIVVTDPPEMA